MFGIANSAKYLRAYQTPCYCSFFSIASVCLVVGLWGGFTTVCSRFGREISVVEAESASPSRIADSVYRRISANVLRPVAAITSWADTAEGHDALVAMIRQMPGQVKVGLGQKRGGAKTPFDLQIRKAQNLCLDCSSQVSRYRQERGRCPLWAFGPFTPRIFSDRR